jgi:hypothetical protein
MPDDAANLRATDADLRFVTSMDLAKLVAFYDEAMKKAGWTVLGAAATRADGASMAYSRQGQTILISADFTGAGANSPITVTVLYP